MKKSSIFWTIMIINAIVCFIISITLLVNINNSNYTTSIQTIELDNRNHIIEHVKIREMVCSDEVYISRQLTNFIPFGNDYAYLSTWIDGKIKNSKGICYVKIKEKKQC